MGSVRSVGGGHSGSGHQHDAFALQRLRPARHFIDGDGKAGGDAEGSARFFCSRLKRGERPVDDFGVLNGIYGAGAGYCGQAEIGGEAGREAARSEEHTSELQSLMRISYAVFCLKKKTQPYITT